MRSLAALLVGLWLGASVFMDVAAVQSFRSVDRLLAASASSPSTAFADSVRKLGRGAARRFLRAQAGEANRWLFERWEMVEIPLAAVILVASIVLSPRSRAALVCTVLSLVIVAVQAFVLTPEISSLGRLIDSGVVDPARSTRFWTFHGLYSGLELLKLAAGLIAASALILMRPFTRSASRATPSRDSVAIS